ncbi:MAG: hypothetical protein ACOC3Z_00600 [Nanoarchaeota archaeon]
MARPRKCEKREYRKKTVRLNEKSAYILNKIKQKRPMFNFSEYVSQCLIRDFELNTNKYLAFKLWQKQNEVSLLNKEIEKITKKLTEEKNIKLEAI